MPQEEAGLPQDVFLRPRDVAARIGYSVATLATLRCRGQGPAYRKVNRACFYRWGDVVSWLGAARQSTSDAPSAPRAA